MARSALVTFVLAWLIGCGSSEPVMPPAPAENDAVNVPPSEMRTILDGLRSDHAGMQHSALEALERFPSVVRAHRVHVERLRDSGRSEPVRRKAAELLAPLDR